MPSPSRRPYAVAITVGQRHPAIACTILGALACGGRLTSPEQVLPAPAKRVERSYGAGAPGAGELRLTQARAYSFARAVRLGQRRGGKKVFWEEAWRRAWWVTEGHREG